MLGKVIMCKNAHDNVMCMWLKKYLTIVQPTNSAGVVPGLGSWGLDPHLTDEEVT